ncbi:hypothetical protein [Ponticaulis koreensis]|uniref:hypothetical protein n=1 Tax=Ponticaulis koreensis TaxID=1123045 RepID=UPI0003B660B4|nr:hypothetical protein [Ponticaulis koreensis]
MDVTGYFKELHIYELDRRDKILGSVSLPYGLVLIISGAMYGILQKTETPLAVHHCTLIALTSLTFLFLAIVVAKLFRVTFGTAYAYPASAAQLADYLDSLKAHYQEQDSEKAEARFLDFLNSEHIRCAEHNAIANDRRASRLNQSSKWLLFAIFSGTVSAVADVYFTIFG